MVIAKIINWKVGDQEKILLLIQLETEGQPPVDIEAELPLEIAKEIVSEMPPSEATRIHELIDLIHAKIKERILTVEAIASEIESLKTENEDAVKGLKDAKTSLEAKKWIGVIGALATRKQLMTEKRHTIRLLINEEANLRIKLREIQLGKRS
jgi:hypothetical protein